jgi:hypothetical protein
MMQKLRRRERSVGMATHPSRPLLRGRSLSPGDPLC